MPPIITQLQTSSIKKLQISTDLKSGALEGQENNTRCDVMITIYSHILPTKNSIQNLNHIA